MRGEIVQLIYNLPIFRKFYLNSLKNVLVKEKKYMKRGKEENARREKDKKTKSAQNAAFCLICRRESRGEIYPPLN